MALLLSLALSAYHKPLCFSVRCKSQQYPFGNPQAPLSYKRIFSILPMKEIIQFCLLFPVPLQWQGQYLHEATAHFRNNENMARTLEEELKEQAETGFSGYTFV